MSTPAYEQVTKRIIALLEQGTVPWQRPWRAQTDWPRNFVTQKPYRGINVFVLVPMGYESPFWLTFRQASRLGGSVKKGEKACPVVFWKKRKVKGKNSGEEKTIPLLRFYHVFNVAQCEGIGKAPPGAPVETASNLTSKPSEIVANMPARPMIKHGMTSAFYSAPEDYVGLPAQDRFKRWEDYYSTLFHELVHSTGHESRLKRSTLMEQGGFGSDPYCKEELIAEMGAAFLCAQADIVERTVKNSAAYLQGWLKQLREDKTLIVQAAAQAQKAADFILGRRQTDAEQIGEAKVPVSSAKKEVAA